MLSMCSSELAYCTKNIIKISFRDNFIYANHEVISSIGESRVSNHEWLKSVTDGVN